MDIIGDDIVLLHVGTVKYPIMFTFTPCSSDSLNDGNIPFGTTILSATATAIDKYGTDVSTSVISSTSVTDGLKVNMRFNHSTLVPSGKVTVIIYLTLSSTTVLPKRWDGLKLE
jgi:hypothetical protein